ncbi:19549_t:CDS:2 [Rhizophagus irregularis]|nr:19549_t:CDS:2 [Rhizophagus irregularis]
MSKNTLVNFILWILLQIVVEVNSQLAPSKPIVVFGHTATFVKNKLYILGGGYNNATLSYDPKTLKVHENRLIITLNEVYIYDIINDSWNTDCDGQRIIIYRGYFNDPGYLDNSLYVLDLTIFNWYIPKTTGNIQIFNQNRSTLIGRGCDKSVESDILLLDIKETKTNRGKDDFGQEIVIPTEKVNNNEARNYSSTFK